MKVGALCCGMGNFAKGFERAGHEIVWGVDNNQSAYETFKHRFPEAATELSDVVIANVGYADVIVAGFPCQPFSYHGEREGFDDVRTDVLADIMFIALARDVRFVVLENVPGSLKYLREIESVIEDNDYKLVQTIVMNAYKDCGIPQDRTRVFYVAEHVASDSGFVFTPDIFVDQKSLDTYIDRTEKQPYNYYYNLNKYTILNQIPEDDRNVWNMYGSSRLRYKKDGLVPTLKRSMGTGGNNIPIIRDNYGIRKLTWQECLEMQGVEERNVFPDGISDTEKYKLIGNSVCEPMAYKIGKEMNL